VKNWRKILSWKQVPRELKVGSKVRVIKVAGTLLRSHWIGVEGTILDFDPNNDSWQNISHKGVIKVLVGQETDSTRYIYFPFNFWRDYLEILE
jgi:hypothetical protein